MVLVSLSTASVDNSSFISRIGRTDRMIEFLTHLLRLPLKFNSPSTKLWAGAKRILFQYIEI